MKKEKITLKEFRDSDKVKISKILASKELCDIFDLMHPHPEKMIKEFISRAIAGYADRSEFIYAIYADETLIGMINLKEIDYINKNAVMSYWLCQEQWGKGYMTQAVNQMLNFGLKDLKLHKIYAYVCVENIASVKVLKKSKFKKEARLKEDKKWKGKKWADVDVYSKFKEKVWELK